MFLLLQKHVAIDVSHNLTQSRHYATATNIGDRLAFLPGRAALFSSISYAEKVRSPTEKPQLHRPNSLSTNRARNLALRRTRLLALHRVYRTHSYTYCTINPTPYAQPFLFLYLRQPAAHALSALSELQRQRSLLLRQRRPQLGRRRSGPYPLRPSRRSDLSRRPIPIPHLPLWARPICSTTARSFTPSPASLTYLSAI
jgi:hypothetical protein